MSHSTAAPQARRSRSKLNTRLNTKSTTRSKSSTKTPTKTNARTNTRSNANTVPAAKLRSRVHLRERGALDQILEEQIRRQFFGASVAVVRYRVSIDEVFDHLIGAGLAITPRPQRVLLHLPDVIQVVACARGDATAWTDALNAHAWCLDRACSEQLGTTPGLTFARRFWRDLRRATAGGLSRGTGVAKLQHYSGVRPLRLWLADRMLGAAANRAAMRAGDVAASLDRECGSRTLPLPVGHVGGTAT